VTKRRRQQKVHRRSEQPQDWNEERRRSTSAVNDYLRQAEDNQVVSKRSGQRDEKEKCDAPLHGAVSPN